MDLSSFLPSLGVAEIVLCLTALGVVVLRKQWADYRALGIFLATRASFDIVLGGLLYAHGVVKPYDRVAAHSIFVTYTVLYWISYAIESVITLIVVYSIFRLAMAPLKGLQNLGMLVFRWAAAISVVVALGSVFAPGLAASQYVINAISQMQRTSSILTLCLLVFVCFAVRPMGLSYRSRIFGVSLGLGLLSTNDLVQSAWMALVPQMKSNYNIINGFVICLTLALWTAYFALPEPKRRLIVLPTTSPFLRWNQISQALGDSPGFVAVGGVPPELFAPAELEVMQRASAKTVTPFPKLVGTPRPVKAQPLSRIHSA